MTQVGRHQVIAVPAQAGHGHRRDGYLVVVYETEAAESPSDEPRNVLKSEHQTGNTELYYIVT